jgi:ABC-2 type transport system permease protein
MRNALVAPASASRGGVRVRVSAVLSIVLVVALTLSSFVALTALIELIRQSGGGADEMAAMLGAVFTVVLVGLLAFDLHEAVSTLLADSDLDLLRRSPLRPGALLTLKLIDALPRTSMLVLALAAPAVAAYHVTHAAPLWAWLVAPIQIVALWLLPLGVGVAVAIVLLRVIPATHVREGLGLVSTFTLLVLWLANSFLLPRVAMWPEDSLDRFRDTFTHIRHSLGASPGGWMAEALVSASAGRLSNVLAATIKLVGVAAASMALLVMTARGNLEIIQARLVPGAGATRHVRHVARVGRTRPGSLLAAFIVRDSRLLLRNWTVLADLLTTAVLWTLLPLVLAPALEAPASQLVRTVLVSLAVAMGTEVGTRMIPLERHSIAWARLAPVPPERWLLGRWASAALLSGALVACTLLAAGLALELPAGTLLENAAIVLPGLVLALALGMWCGAAFGHHEWTNPRGMLTLPGRLTSTAVLIGQVFAWMLVSATMSAAGSAFARWGVLGLAAAIALAISALAWRLAARRLATYEKFS